MLALYHFIEDILTSDSTRVLQLKAIVVVVVLTYSHLVELIIIRFYISGVCVSVGVIL